MLISYFLKTSKGKLYDFLLARQCQKITKDIFNSRNVLNKQE